MCMDSYILHILIPLDQSHMRPKHTSLTPWKKRENKFIYTLILMSKFCLDRSSNIDLEADLRHRVLMLGNGRGPREGGPRWGLVSL